MPLLLAMGVVALAVNDGGAALTTRGVVGIVLWWTVVLALMVGVLPLEQIPRAAMVASAALMLLGVLALASTTWAPSAERAFAEAGRILLYAGVLTLSVLLGRRTDAGRWVDGLGLGIAVVALLALAQRLIPGLLPTDVLPEQLAGARTRLSYPVGYWNGLAIFLGLGFPLLLSTAVAPGPRLRRAAGVAAVPALCAAIFLTSSRGGAAVAIIGTIAFLALTARRLATLQAIGAAALGGALAIAALRSSPELVDGVAGSPIAHDDGPAIAVAIVACCLGAGALYAALTSLLPAFLPLSRAVQRGVAAATSIAGIVALAAVDPAERFRVFKSRPAGPTPDESGYITSHLFSGAGSGRWQFWSSAVDQWQDRPLLGGGAGSFEPWWAQHGSLTYFIRNAHSLWLETLGELGLVGFVLVVTAFAVGLVTAVRRLVGADDAERVRLAAITAVIGAFVVGAAIDWIWQLPVVAAIALICLALATGPATAPSATPMPAREREPHDPRLGRYAAGLAVVLVGWAVIVLLAIPLLAHLELRSSARAAAADDLSAAADHAASARAIEPWAASPWVQLALVAERRNDLPGARDALGEALERDTTDWRLRLIGARLATKAGDIDEAKRFLADARRLNPRSPLLRPAGSG